MNEHLHASIERQKQTVTRAARAAFGRTALSQHRKNQTAMVSLHVEKARQRRTEAERFGIGSVDTADHRLGHAFECFFTESSPHETCETLVANTICALSRQKKIRRHPQLAADGEYV